ncbi:transcriptional regulator [Vibrio fortis]|uniref:transcriptional regulator n=1 Tax=Vibrio fortis TaxID=212667 RepID=UPI0038CDB3D8
MLNKTTPLFAFAILATATTFNANAAANYEPFIGIDVGSRLSGQMESESTYYGTKSEKDLSSSMVFGVEGGMTINQTHQISIGYDYRGTSIENNENSEGSDDDLEVGTLFTKYNYIVPITQKLAWTVGGKLGYEMFNADYDADDLNGIILGAQTGLNYRFQSWSIGTEVNYVYHTNELEAKWTEEDGSSYKDTLKVGDEWLLMANVKYHF